MSWRQEARALIATTISSALEEKPDLRDDASALFALVSQAYPQGPRKGEAFEIWKGEVAYARTQFNRVTRVATADQFFDALGKMKGGG